MSHSMHVQSHVQRNDRWNSPETSSPAVDDQRIELRRARGHDHKHGDDDLRQLDRNDRAPRRNPLVNAMMQALQGLTSPLESQTTPNATPVEAAESAVDQATEAQTTASAPASTNKNDLKDAAVAFAHELFNALRGNDDDDKRKGHHGGHHHHFGHRHGHGRGDTERAGGGYSNLAQRLQNLASQFAPSQPSTSAIENAGAPAAAPVTTLAAASTPADEPTPTTEPIAAQSASAPVETAAANGLSIDISVNIDIQVKFSGLQMPGGAAAAAPTASPLLAAFEKLLEQLQGPATEQANTGSSVDKLREFLLGIAGNLQFAGAGGEQQDSRPPTGSLINITA